LHTFLAAGAPGATENAGELPISTEEGQREDSSRASRASVQGTELQEENRSGPDLNAE
jgi:hypothetical protein